MKNIKNRLCWSTLISFALISCGGSGSSEQQEGATKTAGITDAIKGANQLKKAADRMGDIEALQKKLQETTPISKEALRTAIPESLLGLKRTKLTLGEAQLFNINSGSAEYTDEASGKEISFSITDGAGEMGSAMIITSSYALNMDMEEETKDGFKRTEEIKGNRATVEQSKDYDGNPRSEITLLHANRFLLSFKGTNIDLATLKKAIDEVDLSTLK
ncbi:hypothetical protein [Olivibacter sitiensis]|uniref:hypothetical protein n=1 Tax=Olivibacter sitiensis TaxID=376470 RepID=UPI00041029AE|nr:hypothetical protein [Olivibacter sitiensis]